ncbi:YqaA family protein [Longimicrobium sp.]|uniref:YqaA family protein n=1 Tax=Longimicrobium sp. TaxID=2029185 RepID=UPI002E365213|nr:VTT domain-containing protein [Longimicrobium sp.]HEX6041391.1 VTT domain-containing protein [Longimicrobium sp.]
MSLLAVWLTTFGVAVLSAVIPLINIEIYLLGASALAPREMVIPLVIAGTLGQVIGKIALYYAGSGALKIPGKRLQAALQKMNTQMQERPRMGGALVFVSATLGLPPYYVVTLAAGAAKMNLPMFLGVSLIGRLIRFAIVVAVPQLAREVVPH